MSDDVSKAFNGTKQSILPAEEQWVVLPSEFNLYFVSYYYGLLLG